MTALCDTQPQGMTDARHSDVIYAALFLVVTCQHWPASRLVLQTGLQLCQHTMSDFSLLYIISVNKLDFSDIY